MTMTSTKRNAPESGQGLEGNDQNPTKGTIMNDATSVLPSLDIERVELALRPKWAPEGEWDDDEAGITYRLDMRHGRAYIYQHYTRGPLDWTPIGDVEVNVRDCEGLTPAEATELAEDLAEAVAVLWSNK